jgi:uncharacterized protein YukE
VATEVSLAEFKVLLSELNHQTDVIDRQRARIEGLVADIRIAFLDAESHWKSPAAETFGDIAREYNQDTDDLVDWLKDIVARMRHTYEQYHITENTAVRAVAAQNDSLTKAGGS